MPTLQTIAIFAVLGVLLAAVYLAACWYVIRAMTTSIARKLPGRTPDELGVSNAEEFSFLTQDGVQLLGWFVPGASERVIVLVHGIYSHAWEGQAPYVVRAYRDAGFNVLLFDSRGQGRSAGHLGLAWMERQDVRAAVGLLLARGFRPGDIGIHGTSYGAATTLLAAAEIPEIGAVVADSAFSDIRVVMLGEVSRRTGLSLRWAKLLGPGLRWIVQRRFGLDIKKATPARAIQAISPRPLFLIHGEQDPIIPVESVHHLQSAAGPNTTVWVLPGMFHTEGVRREPDFEIISPFCEEFLSKITEFFRLHLGSPTSS